MRVALLIEDDAVNRKLMRDILEIKFEVIEADCAEDARSILAETLPDLIVMDVQLTDANGLTLLHEIKHRPRTVAIPVVIVSAHARREDIESGLANGCDMYVTKPITDDPYHLVERIEMLVIPAFEQLTPVP